MSVSAYPTLRDFTTLLFTELYSSYDRTWGEIYVNYDLKSQWGGGGDKQKTYAPVAASHLYELNTDLVKRYIWS